MRIIKKSDLQKFIRKQLLKEASGKESSFDEKIMINTYKKSISNLLNNEKNI